jgi:hypothetical protein
MFWGHLRRKLLFVLIFRADALYQKESCRRMVRFARAAAQKSTRISLSRGRLFSVPHSYL